MWWRFYNSGDDSALAHAMGNLRIVHKGNMHRVNAFPSVLFQLQLKDVLSSDEKENKRPSPSEQRTRRLGKRSGTKDN